MKKAVIRTASDKQNWLVSCPLEDTYRMSPEWLIIDSYEEKENLQAAERGHLKREIHRNTSPKLLLKLGVNRADQS